MREGAAILVKIWSRPATPPCWAGVALSPTCSGWHKTFIVKAEQLPHLVAWTAVWVPTSGNSPSPLTARRVTSSNTAARSPPDLRSTTPRTSRWDQRNQSFGPKRKTWANAQHGHGIAVVGGAPLAIFGASFTDRGLRRATAAEAGTWNKLSLYGEAEGGNTLLRHQHHPGHPGLQHERERSTAVRSAPESTHSLSRHCAFPETHERGEPHVGAD